MPKGDIIMYARQKNNRKMWKGDRLPVTLYLRSPGFRPPFHVSGLGVSAGQ